MTLQNLDERRKIINDKIIIGIDPSNSKNQYLQIPIGL